jgi:hypothetical protein
MAQLRMTITRYVVLLAGRTARFNHLAIFLVLCCTPWFAEAERARAQAGDTPQAETPATPKRAGEVDAQETLAALEVETKPKRQFALFRTAALDPKLQELGAALDPVVLSELNTIGSIEVTARPSLDLPAMQLAIDCVGEIAECMAAVTREAGVEALVAPVLRSNGDLVLVTLLYFDTHENAIKGVTRQLAGRSVAQAMLDAVPEMVREAFGLAPEPVVGEAVSTEAKTQPPEPQESRRQRAVRIVPWVLGGTGVAMLAIGLGMGVSAKQVKDQADELALSPENSADVSAIYSKQNDAEQRALIANVSFAVGGAALLAGLATWLFLRPEPDKTQAPPVALVPRVSRTQVGLSLEGALGR